MITLALALLWAVMLGLVVVQRPTHRNECKALPGLEVKHASDVAVDEDTGTFEGYAAVFGNVDRDNDILLKGAAQFETQVPLLAYHDQTRPVGVATLCADDFGIKCKGTVALGTNEGKQMHELLKVGAVASMSIGYRTKAASRDKASGVRTLKSVQVMEVSLVPVPANAEARVLAVKAYGGTTAEAPAATTEGGAVKVESKAIAGSYQALTRELEESLREQCGCYCYVTATFADHVVYEVYAGEERTYSRPYTRTDDGEVEWGEPQEIEVQQVEVPVSGKAAPPLESKRFTVEGDILLADLERSGLL